MATLLGLESIPLWSIRLRLSLTLVSIGSRWHGGCLPVAGSARRDRSVTVQTEAVRLRFEFTKYVKREHSEKISIYWCDLYLLR